MQFSIVSVNKDNYALFDDMVFRRVHNRERTPEEKKQPRDFAENHKMLADKNLHVYAAEAGGRFVGWVSAVFIPKVGHPKYGGKGFLDIDELWTDPACRQHGIAQALMTAAEQAARAMDVAGLRLYVGGDNAPAYRLYTRCGYKDRGAMLTGWLRSGTNKNNRGNGYRRVSIPAFIPM